MGKDILAKALEKIKPTDEEEKALNRKIDGFIAKAKKSLHGASLIRGGSIAKGTWLKDDYDTDIFACYSVAAYKGKSTQLSDLLEACLKKAFPKKEIVRLHGSRDYFQLEYEGISIEVIPILAIKEADAAANITDVSPLHAAWVAKHPQFRDDARLLKQFCKSLCVYGAESYIAGFSGYVCEILTIHYRGFRSAITGAAKWKPQVVIDTEKHYADDDPLFVLNASKRQGPLVIIDPVQKGRNAATAVGTEAFSTFVAGCKKFQKKPSLSFFEEKPLVYEELRQKAIRKKAELVALSAALLKGKKDIAGSKLVKVFVFLKSKLKEAGFMIIEENWHWDGKGDALLYFLADKKPLSQEEVKRGPELVFHQHAERFRLKYRNTFVRDGIIYATAKRKHITIQPLVKELLAHPYVMERVKEIRQVNNVRH